MDDFAHSVSDAAKHGLEEASKVKELKKFVDLELEVFASTADADRKNQEEEARARSRCGGLLHPETTISVCCTSSSGANRPGGDDRTRQPLSLTCAVGACR